MRKTSLAFKIRACIAGVDILTLLLSFSAFAMTQNAYRWRNDDGTETTATWAAGENVPATVFRGTRERLRFGVANSGTDGEMKNDSFTRLQHGDDYYNTLALDPGTGNLYVGTLEDPARIIKYQTTPTFAKVGEIALAPGENVLYGASIDAVNGFAYFSTYTAPIKIVKVRLSDFTRVATLTLNAGEDYARTSTLAGSFLYVVTGQAQGKVVKVDVTGGSTFSRVAALTLNAGDDTQYMNSSAANDGKLYFPTNAGEVVKVDLATMTRDGSLATPDFPGGVAIDPVNDKLYTTGYSSKIDRVDIAGGVTFANNGTLAVSISQLDGAIVVDPAAGKLYAGAYTTAITKVDLGTFTESAFSTSLQYGDASGLQLSTDGSKLYDGIGLSPGHVLRIDTATLASTVVADGSSIGNSVPYSAVIDTVADTAYIGTAGSDGTNGESIAKVDLATMQQVGSIQLPNGYVYLDAAAIDQPAGYAYFVTYSSPTTYLVRVRLSDFTYTTLVLPSNGPGLDYAYDALAIDTNPAHHYLYMGTYSVPSVIAQIDLNTFTEGSEISLTGSEGRIYGAFALDTANNKLYAGTYNDEIVRIDVTGSGMTRETALSVGAGFDYPSSSAIDVAGGRLYASLSSYPISYLKIDITGGTSFSQLASITMNDVDYADNADIDTQEGYVYLPDNATPGQIARVRLSDFTEDPAETLNLPDDGAFAGTVNVDAARGYAYVTTAESPGLVARVSIVPRKRLRLEYGAKTTTCAAVSSWTAVANGNAWTPSTSPNVSDSTATTNVASGVTDGNATFGPGYVMTGTAQTPAIMLRKPWFTEAEYSIVAAPTATPGNYCFRLTDAGTAIDSYANYAEATLKTNDPTVSNAITLGRLKAGVSTAVAISFTLQNTLSGPLTVTFPAAFTVTAPASVGSSSGCLSGFGFTGSTLTATKTACTGTIVLGGATVTNPVTPGVYTISWVNDDPGSGNVVIVANDQVNVNASIDPSLTFNAGSQAAATACDGTFSGNGGTLALGTLTTGAVTSSDAASINHICTRVATNAGSGAVVSVKSLNALLKSTSAPTDTIPSATGTVVAGTAQYGLCAGSGGGDSGRDVTAPSGAVPAASSPFNGSCSAAAHAVGGVTTSVQNVWTVAGPSQNAFFRLYVKAAISSSTVGHADYSDSLTFMATGTY